MPIIEPNRSASCSILFRLRPKDAIKELAAEHPDDSYCGPYFILAYSNFAAYDSTGIVRLLDIVGIHDPHLMRQNVALLENPTRNLPFARCQGIGKIESEYLLHPPSRAREILKANVRRLLQADLTPETVERRNDVFQRISDEVISQFLIDRFGKGKLLACQFKVFRQDLN